MKSARFLVVALLAFVGIAGCASLAARKQVILLLQKKYSRVAGYAVDAVSRQPAAGIHIEKNGVQTVTAKDGYFMLRYPDTKQQLSQPDKLEELAVDFSTYAGRVFIPADTAQLITLPLLRTLYQFPPDGCLHPADSVHLSPCISPWDGLPGSQQAFLIQDSSIQQPRELRALTFRVGKNGFVREPLRVFIYRYNGAGQPPGEMLLTGSYQICPPAEGVFSYDLSSYNVLLPANGFFLALEYAVGSDKFYFEPYMVAYKPTGPILRPPCARADTRTWKYTTGKGWHRATTAENCWPLYEGALSVEVEPTPVKH